MRELTLHVRDVAPDLDAMFRAAISEAQSIKSDRSLARMCGHDYSVVASVRARHGFVERPSELLTPPEANAKLDKSSVPAYGLTLHSFRSVLPAYAGVRRLSINACPNAGHCVRVCVLKTGNGRFDTVPRAWLWRTDLLARHSESFARVLALELVRAVRKHGEILFRPNVDSDVAWQELLPSLTNGEVLPEVLSYGYSKRPETLTDGDGTGWLGARYRVAFSWNEDADADDVAAFIDRGGNVAAVTSRRKGQPTLTRFPFGTFDAVDADKTDEWILEGRGVVGDLSAKGKARKLIGKSAFVVAA